MIELVIRGLFWYNDTTTLFTSAPETTVFIKPLEIAQTLAKYGSSISKTGGGSMISMKTKKLINS